MLKIKDNVDLKELERYGFTPTGLEDRPDYEKQIRDDWANSMRIIVKSYCNQIQFMSGGIPYCYLDNTLYDLIKDGLVEKTKEREEK